MVKRYEQEDNSITKRRRELFTSMENKLKNMNQYNIPDNVKSSGSSRKFGKGNIAIAQNNVAETQSMPEKISPKKKNYLATIPEPSMSSSPVKKMSDPKNNKPLMEITNGPRKGTQLTLSGNTVTPIKKFGSVNALQQFESRPKATGFKAGKVYRTPTGLDITPGEGLDAVETLGLMRTPVHGGTRRRSNLEGKSASGQSPIEKYHRNFQADRDYNPGVSKATGSLANMNVGDASGFSEAGQKARNQTRQLRALREQADNQNKIDLENMSQVGQTNRANLANLGAMDRTMLQEYGNEQDRDIDRQELELEKEGLGIDRMRAEADAAYKEGLIDIQGNSQVDQLTPYQRQQSRDNAFKAFQKYKETAPDAEVGEWMKNSIYKELFPEYQSSVTNAPPPIAQRTDGMEITTPDGRTVRWNMKTQKWDLA